MDKKIQDVQKLLSSMQIDGWLLYDFRRSNPLIHDFLGLPKEAHLTRRFFYWIPSHGKPVRIVHQIESHVLDALPGEKKIYLKWQTLDALLKETLKGAKKIAMEYSPRGAIPYLSKVDGGTIDLVRETGVQIVSSGQILQVYSCTWDDALLKSHLYAANVLEEAVQHTWDWISDELKRGRTITEYAMGEQILEVFAKHDCVADGFPICAIGPHSADPHYTPSKESSSILKRGDWVLIDISCKKKADRAVFADITRVAVADERPTKEQQAVFDIVRSAQRTATEFIRERISQGQSVRGYEADQVCRQVIEEAGYGSYFIHRTGHNLHTEVHGPGAHLDSLETFDDRLLIPRTCFTIEPGIYLSGSFGVRLEYDVFIHDNQTLQITGGLQEQIKTFL
jgi:Xaa-Pro aminopeptidase